ncbi:MAG TPA: HAD-IB family hydrolase [Spirochaetota bacterium]|nr:HAD-IB family hydrolase [Spirochaetota bacterium]
MIKIALFDIDLTLIKKDSFLLFLLFMIKKEPLRLFFLPYILFISFLRIFRLVSMEFFKQSWLLFIKGIEKKKLDALSKVFFERVVKNYVKPGVEDYIDKLKSEGYAIVFATASFEFYIKYIKEYFDADYFFGTKIIFKNDKASARIDGKNCKGSEKITRIIQILDKNQIDIENSISFSDSKTDLPFLELCSKFFYVNPKKWEVLKIVE